MTLNGTALMVATAVDVAVVGALHGLGQAYPAWQPDLNVAIYVVVAVCSALGVSQQVTQAQARARARAAAARGV